MRLRCGIEGVSRDVVVAGGGSCTGLASHLVGDGFVEVERALSIPDGAVGGGVAGRFLSIVGGVLVADLVGRNAGSTERKVRCSHQSDADA